MQITGGNNSTSDFEIKITLAGPNSNEFFFKKKGFYKKKYKLGG